MTGGTLADEASDEDGTSTEDLQEPFGADDGGEVSRVAEKKVTPKAAKSTTAKAKSGAATRVTKRSAKMTKRSAKMTKRSARQI